MTEPTRMHDYPTHEVADPTYHYLLMISPPQTDRLIDSVLTLVNQKRLTYIFFISRDRH